MGLSTLPHEGKDNSDDLPIDKISRGLSSLKTSHRLNQIDRVRALGVGDHIALPQLVVCGDRSAGKSSVLEGISGCPFPRQDGLCTRFPNEIVLRHNTAISRKAASLIPSPSRTSQEKDLFAAFSREFEDFDELPGIIQEASRLMGVRCSEFSDAPAFATDVLRLEVVGNTGLHLTLVDLPGLISVSENPQDIDMVRRLVDSYLESSRTIILAVIPATSDAETQTIIQRARHFDKDGIRTIGVITKPDLINKGTEERVARLAKNLDRTKLHHGFFLMKNPSPTELEMGVTFQQRAQAELDFFSSASWKAQGLDGTRVGIENLRRFLQEILDSHIERELPKVREEVHLLLKGLRKEIAHLGPERSQPTQIRMFLTRVSTEFQSVVKNGLEGNYDARDGTSSPKGDVNTDCHLRAVIHIANENFADFMRMHGQQRKVVPDTDEGDDPCDKDYASDAANDSPSDVAEGNGASLGKKDEATQGEEVLVTKKEMLAWVKKMYLETRGRELPGNYNHSLLKGLFHAQSYSWGKISQSHVDSVVLLVTQYLSSVFKSVLEDTTVRERVWKNVKIALDKNIEDSHEELGKLLQDEQGHPITYNHYYTDNIQKARHENTKEHLESAVKNAIQPTYHGRSNSAGTQVDISRLVDSLQARIEVNMVDRACSEALIDLDAYYKVAMKTFVDNVCRQVIERHVLAPLPGVFDPTVVSGYSDEDLLRLAAESPQTSHRRVEAIKLQKTLKQCLQELSL
ncbi:Dynamin [Penicillium cataractarum]|uniref:Dynamin n=1 Tax=Penicillium cataractarum TaxID=2100454 RepID=A0A9W9RXE9_9EURO|nr:Dynamin [Penicillium cataractarum]KAJ5367956.1 Dynamin [Penicillium cataractarum]